MSDELKDADETVTTRDLKYSVVVCLTALLHLGYIKPGEFAGFHSDFDDVCEEKGLLGGTSPDGQGGQVLINPKVKRSQLFEIIAHESVHAIQYMKGRARRVGAGVIDWQGVQYQILPGDDPNYDNQPWEKEAHQIAPIVIDKINTFTEEELERLWQSIDD